MNESSDALQDGASAGQSKAQLGGSCQFGPIVALEISPFFPDVILTAGGWDWSLWKGDFLKAPLMRSPFAPVQYTCAAWSPTRPGACLQTAHAAP